MTGVRGAYKKKISYYFDREIGEFYFGAKHPMKPFRILITHELIINYGLYKDLSIFKPYRATSEDMKKFHSDDYITFLRSINLNNITKEMKGLMKRFEVGMKETDCPIFDGLYNFSQISAGGSLSAATHINRGDFDIAINWSGGLHHAKKSQASGFCYVNDIVLCILELLKVHKRVLYLDIDVHHGDGVEEAFYTTDRVMTVSFHQYGDDFFPGTGNYNDVGVAKGKYYSVNVPLRAGINDDDYEKVFVPIVQKVVQTYGPSVIVLQCGSDCLAGDRIGDFNLTLDAHGKCIKHVRNLNIPLILLGGGGYTVRNVSRCWTYDTSIACDREIPNDLPHNDYFHYFAPDYQLNIKSEPDKENMNTDRSLNDSITKVYENLRELQPVPSVQIAPIPDFLLRECTLERRQEQDNDKEMRRLETEPIDLTHSPNKVGLMDSDDE